MIESLQDLLTKPEPKKNTDVKGPTWPFNWHYMVEFVVDLREREDGGDPEILKREYITLVGDMDSDAYFSECVWNALPSDFLPTHGRGINFETDEFDIREPAVYRFTFGVRTQGEKYWTDCGYEYDSWEEYTLINFYKFTEEEVEVCWDPLDPMDDYDIRELDYPLETD